MSKTASALTAATLPLAGTEVVYLVQGGNSRMTTAASFYIPGGTDVAITDGGTGASTASAARTALGLAIGTDVQAFDADLSSWAAITRAAGYDTFAATPSSANLAALVTGETGSGALVFGTSPTLVTPALGTPTALVLTNATGLPIAGGGTGQATASAAFDALAPTTTRGDLIFRNATTNARLAAGTSGYALIAAGAGADPAWTGYTQAGTGSLVRTWQARAQERISVLDFTGVDPTGVSDSRAGIVAAAAAASALGKALYFPAGSYLLSAAVTPAGSSRWIGESKVNTKLITTSATADILAVSSGNFSLDGFTFDSTVTRTGGNCINITSSGISITNFVMNKTFQGINHSTGGISSIYVANGTITTTSTSSIGIRLSGGVAVEYENIIVVWDGISHPFASLYIDNGGDYSFNNMQLLAGSNACQIAPTTGQSVLYCRFARCWFDTSVINGLSISAGGTGTVGACDFVQCWFSTGVRGVDIGPGASASVSNINFDNCFMFGNTGQGARITGATAVNTKFTNCSISGPGTATGISIITGAGRVRVQGCTIENLLNGILTDGTPTAAKIYDNSIVNCTNAINGAFITGSRVERNDGYNPVGAAAITTAASPYTYTAGSSPETIYTSASTSITAATQGGVSILPAALGANVPMTIELDPNGAVVITYTGTLTAKKMIH